MSDKMDKKGFVKVHINDLEFLYGHINAGISRLGKITVADTTQDGVEKEEVLSLLGDSAEIIDRYV